MKKSVEDCKSDSILIIAAEASSCMYAKAFIKAWQRHQPETHFFGVGDREMASQGMQCLGLAEEMAVVGLQEVIGQWKIISQCFKDVVKMSEQEQPRFALLLDYPGFNLRLAKKLKSLNIPVVYYISPQLWAWKKGRVKQVRDYVDDMMVVFPFEVDFYQQYGITAHFVGHPLVEVIEAEGDLQTPIQNEVPVLGLMPGSRRSEIRHNFTTQIKAAQNLAKRKNLKVKVLVAPTLDVQEVKSIGEQWNLEAEYMQDKPTAMIQECDLILTASGTATLQVALCLRPMVVMYRMNPATAFFAKLLVRSVDAFCIVNLIAGKKIVPELFQSEANPKRLADELEPLTEQSQEKDHMIKQLKKVKEKLGKGGATDNLVHFLLNKYGV